MSSKNKQIKPLQCMKIDELEVAAYKFWSAGIRYVMNITYDIPSKSKLSFFCLKECNLVVNMHKKSEYLNHAGLF